MEWKFTEFMESDKSLKHELGQLKLSLCYLCLMFHVCIFILVANIFVAEFNEDIWM